MLAAPLHVPFREQQVYIKNAISFLPAFFDHAQNEMPMDDQERDYFRRTIRDLERTRRRWQLFALSLLTAFGLFLVVGIGGVMFLGFTTARQRMLNARLEEEAALARAQEAQARTRQADAALQQARDREAKARGELDEAKKHKGIQK